MPLSDECKEALFSFVGYGSTSPRFVFIGPEEWSEGLLLNLETRCGFPRSYHNRDAACTEFARAYEAHGLAAEATVYRNAMSLDSKEPTWTFASKLIASLRDPPGDTDAWKQEYARLGSAGSDTLLTELFPLPKPSTGCWPPKYTAEFGYTNQARYYDAVWPRDVVPGTGECARADLLASTLDRIPMSRNTIVIGYGRGGRRTEFWARFDALFRIEGRWTTVVPNVAEIARHATGAVVARLAHPSRKRIRERHIPGLVAALHRLP